MTPLIIFAVCAAWECGAIYYTRLAAHALRTPRGYVSIGIASAAMAALGLWGLKLAVLDSNPLSYGAWVLGTAAGAVAGLAMSGREK